jgi:hypothetical protein
MALLTRSSNQSEPMTRLPSALCTVGKSQESGCMRSKGLQAPSLCSAREDIIGPSATAVEYP